MGGVAVPVGPPIAISGGRGGGGGEIPEGEALPTLFGAVTQLGLKLDARKDNVEIIVIDHVEKTPTEN